MKKIISILVLFAVCMGAHSQARTPAAPTDRTQPATQPAAAAAEDAQGARTSTADERLRLAVSNIDYPVTPGDIYQLSYRESSGAILLRQYQVDAVSVLDMGVFGKTNASGMTFFQLKQQIEEMIARNYTYSIPSFNILAPGVFQVTVRDTAGRIQYETAWGMTRLSEVANRIDAPHFSRRNVERVSRSGRSERFDLLKSDTSEQANNDPLMRSGDMIVLHGTERIVQITGEVRRPGRYELLSGEGLRDLVEVFAGGVTSRSDTERVRINRVAPSGEMAEYFALPKGYASVKDLNDGDSVFVPDKTSKQSVIWFEGAVSFSSDRTAIRTNADLAAPNGTAPITNRNGRFSYNLRPGEKLSDILGEIKSLIFPNADLTSTVLSIPGEPVAKVIDLTPLLSGATTQTEDPTVPPNSVIFIPELRSAVSVEGAVFVPGSVPFRPGATAQYYISQCGGINPERNSGGRYIVFNSEGVRQKQEDAIKPGYSIFVENNAFGYNLERSISVWIPIISLVITVLTFGMTAGVFHVF